MLTVMVVEDEEIIQKMVCANLRASGYEVLSALDGDAAIAILKVTKPDIILLDIKMPGLSGWEVLTKMRTYSHLKAIPVIIMTASLRESDTELSAQMGAQSLLVKPFSIEQMFEEIECVLGKKGSQHE